MRIRLEAGRGHWWWLIILKCTLNTSKAEDDLGCRPIVTIDEGRTELAELR